MKTMQFILSVVLGTLLLNGTMQSMVAAPPATQISALSVEEKQQWEYVQNSLDQHVVGAHKTQRMVEKVLKYTAALGLPALAFFYRENGNESYLLSLIRTPVNDICDNDQGQATLAGFLCCGSLFALGTGSYILVDKIFATISSSQNQAGLKNLLVEWCNKINQLPISLHPLIKTLHSDAHANKLTNEQCNKAIAALLAISAVALTQQ